MTYGYIRVSTENQNTENQKLEIERFCAQNNLKIDCWIEDIISGTKDPKCRKLGKIIMENCRENDMIICTELSRLGRSLLMIMNTLSFFLDHKVMLWTIKDNFRLSNDITSKVLSFAFGLSAEIERQLISQRTITGLQRARHDGIHIGRPAGRKSSYYKLSSAGPYLITERNAGRTKQSLATEFGVSWKTVNSQLKRLGVD